MTVRAAKYRVFWVSLQYNGTYEDRHAGTAISAGTWSGAVKWSKLTGLHVKPEFHKPWVLNYSQTSKYTV